MINLNKYFKVWWKRTNLSAAEKLATRGATIMYVIGKFIRYFSFILTLKIIFQSGRTVAGYNQEQMVVFFLVFNLFDIIGQLFFRGVYFFRQKIISGDFDLTLVKPINPLFNELTAQTDLLDLPLLAVVLFQLFKRISGLTFLNLINLLFLSVFSFVLITAIHIFVAGVGVLTTEVEHIIWIYRDLSLFARVPVDIYQQPLESFLTFIVPVGMIFTFPARSLLGVLTWQNVFYSFIISSLFLVLAVLFWRAALKEYSSASS
jgi:ABC-2 type transport system permease protein